MDLRVIKSDKNSMEVEVKGETHTFVNWLRSVLWDVKGVKEAGYNIKHPLVAEPRLTVRTDIKPKKAFDQAVSLMKDQLKELKGLVKKLN